MFSIKAENDCFCSLEIRQLGHLKVLNTANCKNIFPKDDPQTTTASANAISTMNQTKSQQAGKVPLSKGTL